MTRLGLSTRIFALATVIAAVGDDIAAAQQAYTAGAVRLCTVSEKGKKWLLPLESDGVALSVFTGALPGDKLIVKAELGVTNDAATENRPANDEKPLSWRK